jgi:hypothetical protein
MSHALQPLHPVTPAAEPDRPSRRDILRERILTRCYRDHDGCLIWTGPDSGSGRGGGYPRMSVDGGTMAVHIVMWVIEHGPIPPGKELDHNCSKRRCVDPWRCTELVSHIENCRRRDARNGVVRRPRKRRRTQP